MAAGAGRTVRDSVQTSRTTSAWVAQRLEPAAEKHVAMLPVLQEVARTLAWTWLRVQAYYEQQDRKDADE